MKKNHFTTPKLIPKNLFCVPFLASPTLSLTFLETKTENQIAPTNIIISGSMRLVSPSRVRSTSSSYRSAILLREYREKKAKEAKEREDPKEPLYIPEITENKKANEQKLIPIMFQVLTLLIMLVFDVQ